MNMFTLGLTCPSEPSPTMMSADFDAFEGNNTKPAAAASAATVEDNPLAALDAAPPAGSGMGGAAGTGYSVDATATGNADGSLFRTENVASGNVRHDGDGDLFDNVNGGMEQYELNDEDPNTVEIHEEGSEEEEEEEDNGDNLLNLDGYDRQRPQDGDYVDGEDHRPQYGTDRNTASMEANSRGERNNNGSGRGIFGGWGSSRNNNGRSGDGDDLINGGDPSGGPAWTGGASAANSNKGGGGGSERRGWFGGGRRSTSNVSNSPKPSFDTKGIGSDDYSNSMPRGADDSNAAYGEGGLTGDADEDLVEDAIEAEQRADSRLRPGDHIFIWQTYGINPRAYQRHAVVFSVTKRGEGDPMTERAWDGVTHGSDEEMPSFDLDTLYTEEEDPVEVTVVSFYQFQRSANNGAAQAQQAASGNRRGKRQGCKREYLYDFIGPDAITKKKPVRKVLYGRKVKKGLLSQKAGVGTALKKDQVGLILARVQYVMDHPDHLPDHHALSANGECASLWCVTGKWCTLQGASILAITSVGQAGGALLAGGLLSNLTILVPMPGVWGMAGWWWYVPATVAYPFLVPMLVALGMASLVPLEILRRNRKKWRGITDGLNHEFWSGTSERVREEHFGQMATAEREAEMRTFFGVRENEKPGKEEDQKYMPLGSPGGPGGAGDDGSDDEDEAMAMQRMEATCQGMEANMDLSGKPPEKEGSQKGAWGSFVGSFRRNGSSNSENARRAEAQVETERFQQSY